MPTEEPGYGIDKSRGPTREEAERSRDRDTSLGIGEDRAPPSQRLPRPTPLRPGSQPARSSLQNLARSRTRDPMLDMSFGDRFKHNFDTSLRAMSDRIGDFWTSADEKATEFMESLGFSNLGDPTHAFHDGSTSDESSSTGGRPVSGPGWPSGYYGGGGGVGPRPTPPGGGIADTAAGLFGEATAISRSLWDTWTKFGAPQIAQMAKDVDPELQEGRIAVAEGMATADVRRSYDTAEADLRRSLGRYGVNPGSGGFASGLRRLALGKAADTAGARTTARLGIMDRIRQDRMALAQLTQQAGMAGLGGITSVAGSLADIDLREKEIAAHLKTGSQMAKSQDRASRYGLLGGLAGLGTGLLLGFSDRRIKQDAHVVDTLPNGLNIYEFKFIDDPDNWHTGLMADEVAELMPEHVYSVRGIAAVNYAGVFRDMI